jgi:cytochrome d ubiquinol oxidase subunit I
VGESTLYTVLNENARIQLKDTPLLNIVDAIISNTVREVGVYTVTFQSPVYLPSLIHTIFAAITVSAFTLAGGYALSYSRKGGESSKHAKLGLSMAYTLL